MYTTKPESSAYNYISLENMTLQRKGMEWFATAFVLCRHIVRSLEKKEFNIFFDVDGSHS